MHERNPNRENPELENITLDEVIEKLSNTYHEHTGSVEAYADVFQTAAL